MISKRTIAVALDAPDHFLPKTCSRLLVIAAAIFFGLEFAHGAPFARRAFHTAVWTGNEMIVWGGTGSGYLNDGARYNPADSSWTAVSISGGPAARAVHTAVWTGNEMLVWGGVDASGVLNDGGRYNPLANSWTAPATNSAPAKRYYHTAVWTGSEMFVWGGFNGSYLNDGARYIPSANSWSALITNGGPVARGLHTAVWTGNAMIVWGGSSGSIYLNGGGRYSPVANFWVATTTNGAPAARSQHTAVWTGSEMLVWGGYNGSNLNDGGRYDPVANSWTAIITNGAPTTRRSHTAVWTGSEMIVWGGVGPGGYLNDGARYNPAANSWTAVTTNGAPSVRAYHTAVWTGSEMIVWGGYYGSPYLNDGGRYNPSSNSWTPLPPATACQPGLADDFECRSTISGDHISAVANNSGMTKEAGEPDHGGNAGGRSVWWSWTAPFSGGVTLTTAGSDFDTLLGVYTGTNVSTLTTVAGDGRTNLPGSVTFKATAGVNYKIAVDGHDGASGNILLNLTLLAPPANDNFGNRISIASGSVVAGQNLGATMEPGETNHAGVIGGKSVWWSWTPTSNSCVTITTEGSDFDTLLGVYTNAALASLVSVATNDDASGDVISSVTFNAVAGRACQIAVDGYNRAGGNIVLGVIPFAVPPNDNFANATVLSGTNVQLTISNVWASAEAGEPDHGGQPGAPSLWWQWQAPASGGVTIDLRGSDFRTAVSAYTGSTLGTLARVVSGPDHVGWVDHVVFKAVGGTTYRIAVDVDGAFSDPATARLKLALAFNPSPANDDFSNRPLFSGITVSTNGSNVGATTENGEPVFLGGPIPQPQLQGKTVWWNWMSPFPFPIQVTISTLSSNFVSTLAVYSGNNLTNLLRVTGHVGASPTNEVSFTSLSGVGYAIAVDGNAGAEGFFTLSAAVTGAPANDYFTNRITLSGSNIFTTGRNTGANKETGEPDHAGVTGASSVWWSWSAPSAGRLFVTTAGSSFRPLLAVYQGTNVNTLSSVASGAYFGQTCPFFSFLNFDIAATNSQPFQIAVDGESNGLLKYVGCLNLALSFLSKPANDDFISRTPLTGSFLVVTGSVIAASQEAGETVAGYSNGLRTVWYTWTAPAGLDGPTGGVTLRITGIKIFGTTNDPIVGVYQGKSLATLTEVPVANQQIGNLRQLTFAAQAGATYQIVVAGGQSVGEGYDSSSFVQRSSAAPPDPLSETGSFVLRLNYSTLALRVRNTIPARLPSEDFGRKVPFGAEARIFNYGASPSAPVRVRLLTVTEKGIVFGDEGSFTPASGGGVAPGGTNSVAISGAYLPASSVLAVLEEQVGGDWFFRDSNIVGAGLGATHFLCIILVGGGVALLEPGLTGQCFCPAKLTRVLINGPASVNEGSSAAYYGTAFFDNGSSPSFTNTIWSTSNTNKFPITTNGILTAGSITTDTLISVVSYFSYLGAQQSTNKLVTILNLPPPMLSNLLRLPDRNFQLFLQGVPGRQHVVEATTNLTAPVIWSGLITNATSPGGFFLFTDLTATNFSRRFYRAREY